MDNKKKTKTEELLNGPLFWASTVVRICGKFGSWVWITKSRSNGR